MGGGGGRGGHRARFFATRWMANGQFQLQNGHFSQSDWGKFQNNTILTEKSYHDCT